MVTSATITCLVCLLLSVARGFVVHPVHPGRVASPTSLKRRNRVLRFKNDTAVEDRRVLQRCYQEAKLRELLKNKLVVAAIEEYDMDAYNSGMTTDAEDLMKQLEQINPWNRPAHNPELNARWSFVFTGVPTIGMRLITLLSRISVGVGGIEFDDVFLDVSKNQSQVKAIVSVTVFGHPVELNVYTHLQPNMTDVSKGTHLIETFERLVVGGVEIPTPEEWKSSRDLEISYLDHDMMIARTNFGEPHLLLRHSSCSTDDETCDIDMQITKYFSDAKQKYGQALSRCLVDRAFTEGDKRLDLDAIGRIISAILDGRNRVQTSNGLTHGEAPIQRRKIGEQ